MKKITNKYFAKYSFHKINFYNFSNINFKPGVSTCYYKILNVNSSATPEEIKKEYYKLAKRYHPDNTNSKSKDNQAVNPIN
jgi:DnaJ-class molecular chaperone